MSTTYHDAIATGAPANASTFNTPLGDLDAAIADLDSTLDALILGSGTSPAEVIAARSGYTILDDRTDDLYHKSNVLLVDASFVGNTSAKRFTTITLALAAATPGCTIFVAPGIYAENAVMTQDGIKLIGSGAPYYDSGSGRLVSGTIIRGKIDRNTKLGIMIRDLGVDLFGVNSVDCIAGATIGTNTFARFENLSLLGNGNAALSHGLYMGGSYNTAHNIRIYNCYHGIAVHGSYTNISNIQLYSCNGTAIIVKAKSAIDCFHVNITNVTMEGNPAAPTTRSGAIIMQAEDGVAVRRVNVSNVTARYCVNGVVNNNRNMSDAGSLISEISYVNIASDGNLDQAGIGDFEVRSGSNIMFNNCRSTNRVNGYGFKVTAPDGLLFNAGDVYLYGSYADASGSGATNGTFFATNINGGITAAGRVVAPGGYRSYSVTINDDTVYDIPLTTQGMILVAPQTGANSGLAYLLASFRANTTPVCVAAAAGTSAAVSTSTLTGTTGVDGKLTVSAVSGHIYVENRLGSNTTFVIVLFI